MATIKSFTSLKQSKQLVEKLPKGSADMHFVMIDTNTHKYGAGLGHYIGVLPSVPCWSLSALMALMQCVELQASGDGHYRAFWEDKFSEWHDNAVDACVELLERVRKEEEE